MTEHKCNKCEKEFGSNEALHMHTKAKHYNSPRFQIDTKKVRNWGILIVVVALLVFGAATTVNNAVKENAKFNFKAPKGPIHWHPQLDISINGVSQPVSPNIGLGSGGHSPIHTHESNGVLHMESSSPTKKTVTLGYFFEVWNKKFNEECLFNYCTNKGELKMYVNGVETPDFENYFLKDNDKIVIEYTSTL